MTENIKSVALQEWDRCLNDDTSAINEASDALKLRWRDELLRKLSSILQSENPFLKVREYLADAVVATSYFAVLMKHHVDKQGSPISAISHPKISWRLSDHIFVIAQKEDKLKAFVEAQGENMNDLLDYTLLKYQLNHAYMSAINAVRIVMNDYIEGEDWLLQFYISMCVWQEDTIRKEIGIPSLFNEKDQPQELDGLKYWSFLDFVKSGSKLPHRDWQKLYASEFWAS